MVDNNCQDLFHNHLNQNNREGKQKKRREKENVQIMNFEVILVGVIYFDNKMDIVVVVVG